MESDTLNKDVAREFTLLGYHADRANVARFADDVAKLTAGLRAQGADYKGNEIAIMAACVGFMVGKGFRF